jgi:hypothetical protein
VWLAGAGFPNLSNARPPPRGISMTAQQKEGNPETIFLPVDVEITLGK